MHWFAEEGKVCQIMKSDPSSKLKPGLGAVLLQALIPAAVGALFLFKGKPVGAGILLGIGAVLLISGLFFPSLFRRIEKVGQAVGRAVGVGLTWILLAPMFWLVFVPGRLILKLRGIDPLCRKFPTDLPTYWIPRKPIINADYYKRQF